MKKFCIYLLLSAMLTQLIACGGPGSSDETQETITSTEDTETTRIQHQLPDELDFDGASFCTAFTNKCDPSDYYFQDESSSDNMLAAVYRRTMKTEDFLGVDLSCEEDVQYNDYITLYKANDDVYQLLFVWDMNIIKPLITEGYLYNLDTLPYVDFSADWWNGEQMDLLRLTKNTYYATSDFILTDPDAILFNRNMITDNNLEDPYDLVFAGKWTLDKFIEMGTAVINDVNGNGYFYDEDDVNAMTMTDIAHAIGFVPGCDQPIAAKNEEGRLELTLNTEKMLDIADKLVSAHDTAGFINYRGTTSDIVKPFSYGNILFVSESPSQMAAAADYEFDTGIVPMPKYNEAQENYICNTTFCMLMGVSGAIKNPEMVGAVLEFLSWDSKNEVFPTYYDVLLKTRYSQDLETRQMLDIIFDTIFYEVGGVYFGMDGGFCGLWYIGSEHLVYGKSNFAAIYRANKTPAQKFINRFYEAMAIIEGTAETETAEETAS